MYDGVTISAIAAVASNGCVGRDGQLPWRIPGDLRHFKRTTRRHAVVMGRKTLDEIKTPLKGRVNIVLSRSLVREAEGLVVVRTLDDALRAAVDFERAQVARGATEVAEIFVIGGPSVWRLAWPLVDRFYRTNVRHDFAGDTFFPEVELGDFELVRRWNGEGDVPHDFELLHRPVR